MRATFIVVCLLCAFAAGGCSGGQPALNPDQEKQASSLDELGKKSGGDWSKLSDSEKQTMIQIGGSEQGAKMLLLSSSGKLGHKGGPPTGGRPGGPAAGGAPASTTG